MVAGLLVLYPVAYLLQAALNVGDQDARPPTEFGFDNFTGLLAYPQIIINTLTVSFAATVMALILGFTMAWIITRTNVPGRRFFEQMMVVPYYLTPLLGALAWSLLGTPESGFLNQVFRALGGKEYLININSPYGIAWVMALFEGSVAFVMIGAVMKSMDPALEEASQVMGASRLRTMLRITLPLVLPGVLGAAVFVFAEMLGSFAVALVLGLPDRYYVVTTAIYQLVQQYPPKIPLAAAMGTSLFVVMFVTLFIYRRIITAGSYVTITGKAFRPRVNDVGRLRCVLLAVCVFYLFCSVVLPLLTLFYASIQKISTAFPAASNFTTEHFYKAFTMNAATTALGNSLWLALWTATLGVLLMGLISWIIYRSKLPGSGVIEYIVMFPQSVPRLIFAFGMMWAWLVFPIPIYGTLWLLLIAYLTVFLPLGVRTISRRDAADRQEPGGMRADVRRRLELSHPHRDGAAALARPDRRLALAVRRQHPRARRLDPADGPALQGDHAVDRRELVRKLDRTHRRDGADPDAGGGGRGQRVVGGDAARHHEDHGLDMSAGRASRTSRSRICRSITARCRRCAA